MSEPEPAVHDVAACARAWETLRLAHDRVAQRLTAELAPCALSLSEFDVLLALRTRPSGELRMAALRECVPLSQPALSRLVARLVERGLVARCAAADDGRAVVVRLTEAGIALADRAVAAHARAVHAALTSKFTEAEQTLLLRALTQIGR